MRPTATVTLLTALLLPAAFGAHAKPPSAELILRKAEEIRNPDLDYAVDFTIHGVSRGTVVKERDASYSMIARGKDRTVILMRTPELLYGALVLMADNRYWMLLPKATKPWELSGAQMMNGDIATGELSRINLTTGYTVSLAREAQETPEAEDCFRLELTRKDLGARYPRIIYLVKKQGFLPMALEFYGSSGDRRKTVHFGDYRKGALGLRSMRLDVESFDEWKEASTLLFSNLRKLKVTPKSFTPEGLIPFRDAALTARDTATDAVSLEHILRGLASPSRLE